MITDLSDRQMLILCAAAFDAAPTATASRKFLRAYLGETSAPYGGNASHFLAAEMARRIRDHLAASSEATP